MHPLLLQDLARDRHLMLREAPHHPPVRAARGRWTGLSALLLRSTVRRAERRAAALERDSRRLAVVLADVEQRAHAARSRLVLLG